jgi:hypothetical protein
MRARHGESFSIERHLSLQSACVDLLSVSPLFQNIYVNGITVQSLANSMHLLVYF